MAQATIPVMKSMTDAITAMSSIANAHPEAIKIVGQALLALGAGLVAIGTVAVVGAAIMLAPGGVITLAIAGIGAGLAALAAMNWQGVIAVFNGIYNAIVNFISQLGQIPGMIKNAILGGPGVGAPGSVNAPGTPQFSFPHPGEHPGKDQLGYNPTNWVPPANGNQPTTLHTAINIDGRRIASAISTHMARNGSWSGSSSTFDGQAMAAPTDVSFV